ncbi:MAG: hypothetical protein CM15mP74_29120 [Halieaceae bacterium]|nr:MAG: hypothetical protein CM15mP74_29120 [Halieaceae bacterium]
MATPLIFTRSLTRHVSRIGAGSGRYHDAVSQYAVSQPLHNLNAEDNMGELSLVTRLANFASFIPDTLAGILSERSRKKWPSE